MIGGCRVGVSAAICGVLLLLAVGCFETAGEGGSGPRPEAPDFTLTTLDGQPVRLLDQRGKTVILDFWATWCAPCEVQMPVLDTLWKTRGGRDLMVLGLSVDTDPADRVIAWVDERGLGYPIAITGQDLAIDYGVLGFPTLVIVDPEGRIHTRHTGVLSRPELEDILDEIARELAPEG